MRVRGWLPGSNWSDRVVTGGWTGPPGEREQGRGRMSLGVEGHMSPQACQPGLKGVAKFSLK